MAKLSAYYGLCPLIDHRSLLGITPDRENGVVIVTLGNNIAIKFRLSDQKQLHSWRTKHKFISPIIYDKQQSQYVAAFNENFIRVWSGDEEFVDKLKKIRFNQQIYTIFECNDKSFLAFKNGAVVHLEEVINKKKNLELDNLLNVESEYFVNFMSAAFKGYVYVGFIVKSGENFYLLWTRFNESNEREKSYKIPLERDSAELRGFSFHVDQTAVIFYSLWSDGKMFSLELREDNSTIGDLFTVIESLNCREYVSVISLDNNYLAMYGCNSNDEGALLIVYNVYFKVVQSRQPFKLFTNGARIWCIDDCLFFPVGQNLAVVPFYLDTEQLAALVGSHKVVEKNLDAEVSLVQQVQFAKWKNTGEFSEDKGVKALGSNIQDFLEQGLPKTIVFDTILEDILENKNVKILTQVLQYFTDLSESSLAKVLKLILNLQTEKFEQKELVKCADFPQELQPAARTNLLDILFTKSFNDTLLLSHLRSILTLDEVLRLMQYILFLLSEDGHFLPSLNNTETEAKLIEWSCILLDANYQKFLLSRDEKINDILKSLKNHMKEELDSFENLKHVASLLSEIEKGKSIQKTVFFSSSNYYVEDFPLYENANKS